MTLLGKRVLIALADDCCASMHIYVCGISMARINNKNKQSINYLYQLKTIYLHNRLHSDLKAAWYRFMLYKQNINLDQVFLLSKKVIKHMLNKIYVTCIKHKYVYMYIA